MVWSVCNFSCVDGGLLKFSFQRKREEKDGLERGARMKEEHWLTQGHCSNQANLPAAPNHARAQLAHPNTP